MKPGIRSILPFLVAALFLVFGLDRVDAQQRGNDSPRVSPNASVSQTIGTTILQVTYGRPSDRGRTIFGDLVPYRQVWRTGANESTVITFSDPVTIEGERVEAGTYSLYTIPGEDEWVIILNEKLSWGTQYDESEDLLRVRVQPGQAPHQEQFLIYFDEVDETSGTLLIHWARTKVPVQIVVDTN
ncbi:MAG: DUF2911 domain-containing protein [Balneolaceae bacterium]